ncbi:MAG TPA: C25 family cysteine peptidase [Pyrinomonadaceae bacterium]
MHSSLRRMAWRVLLVCVLALLCGAQLRIAAQTCATPGQQGNGGTLTGVVNAYFPGTATANAGATSITLGASRGAATAIASGNLLLVIQMQDAGIDSTQTGAYGNGVANDPATGYNAANNTGRYEFVRATNAVPITGGSVTFVGTGAGTGLLNTYTNAAATATQGQRRFQVVRVPQYTVAILSSTLTAAAWNGATGGILALDASQQLTLGGTVSVNGLGFRPGGALQLAGGAGGTNLDYRVVATSAFHGSKGEGIAGTPRYLYDAATDTVTDTTIDGYPNGSSARGAPGNAGGGGNDGNPTANDQNSGGGGGGNGGAGGMGGNSWSTNLVVGGFGGSTFAQASASRLVLGGGGGTGTRNNDDNVTAASSGGAGGGIVIIRARRVAGTGTITANGVAAFNDTLNDGGGGGGAGGSILISTLSGTLTGLTANAVGGRGGDAWRTQAPGTPAPGERHGPGGGGGGGVIFLSSAPTALSVAGGATGITTTASDTFGAVAGSIGTSATNLTAAQVPGTQSGAQCSPTAVRLRSFEAFSFDDAVMLRWQTGYEVDNLGYQLYREQNGERVRVTPSIIAGSALLTRAGTELTAGYSYAWNDRVPKDARTSGMQYWLEAVDLDGTSEWHGPITPYKASGLSPEQRSALLLNDINSATQAAAQSEWPASQNSAFEVNASRAAFVTSAKAGSSAEQRALNQQWMLASMPAVKIAVRRDGWVRVSREELLAAGLDGAADTRRLQLFADGIEQAIVVASDGSVEFYGRALDTTSTDTRVYWLAVGQTFGKRVQAFKAGDFDSSIQPSSFTDTVERRDRVLRFAALTNGEADNFFGAPISQSPVEQHLTLRGLDTESGAGGLLEVALQGLTSHPHEVRVQLNGMEVGSVILQNREHKSITFNVPASLLQESDNVITLTRGGVGATDVTLLDYVRLNYARKYRAENNRLRFSVESGRATRVEGFTNEHIRVLDLTNADARELSVDARAVDGGYAFTLPPMAGAHTFLAFADEADHPSSVSRNEPSNWNDAQHAADFVIITHRNFRQAIEPLRTWRQRQGLTTVVVDVEDIFDEFGYGAYSPQAINAFLSRASRVWQRAPRYLLLVGDATFDPRRYLGGTGEGELVPGLLLDTNFMEATSDDALADFNGDGLAEMAVGRLPVRTEQEAATLVSKIIAYDRIPHGDLFERGALIVSDRADGFDFQDAAGEIRAQLPAGMSVQMINRDDGDAATVHNQIVTGINRGPALVTYLGHGSVGVWTGDGLLSVADAPALTNGARLPFFVMTTCLNGSYMELGADSLGEALVKATQGGGVAAWASSGLTEPGAQVQISERLNQTLFGTEQVRLGDAIRRAKATTSDADIRRTWILLGDPTMSIK